jgi:hypothetical protein
VFFATLDHGDEGERAFLAANGYLGILGAGVTRERTGWLVELCADALTAPLAPHEGLLRVLVELAVEGADEGHPPANETPGISAPSASR